MEYKNALIISTIIVSIVSIFSLCIAMNPLATAFVVGSGIVGLCSVLGLAKVLQILFTRIGY